MATDKKISELPLLSSITAVDTSVVIHNGADYQFTLQTLLNFVSTGITSGANVSFGTTLPQNTAGKNGDIFINTANNSFAQKAGGSWAIRYTLPTADVAKDGTVLYGNGEPGLGIGKDNDTYIDTSTGIFYNKTLAAWHKVFSMQTGPQGPKGDKGDTGASGAAGSTILNGTINPSNLSTGTNGDFYLNTSTQMLFGPKTNGDWGDGISIIGIPGEQGPQGDAGPAGIDGADGLDGPAGPGVVAGGTTGQILTKLSDADYDTEWVDKPAGGTTQPATEDTAGIIALANLTQAIARIDDTKAMTALKTIALILDEKKKVSYQINPIGLNEVSILMENAGQVNSVLITGATNVKLKTGIAGSYPTGAQTYPFAYAAGDRVFITYNYSDLNNASCNVKLKCQDN